MTLGTIWLRVRSSGYHSLCLHDHLWSMPPYRNLKAWEHAQRLAIECVKAARRFPDYEQDGLANQFRRAAYSIPTNIAEGSAKKGSREYRRYLDIAAGSLAEAETILGIAKELGYVSPADFTHLDALASETGKTLYGLLRKIGNTATKGERTQARS
jgi:four helix bundle protein